ncbi:MAG: hypothetical protein LBP33_08220 [Candidatus Adiutrix sp.]|jgi:hypothetical protein|nr:hypothetical protein [Candidatus Adiutrix sp.]
MKSPVSRTWKLGLFICMAEIRPFDKMEDRLMRPQARFNLIALLISLFFLLALPTLSLAAEATPLTASKVTGRLLFDAGGALPFVIPTDAGYLADVPGYQSTATVTVTGYDAGGGVARPLPGGAAVLWSVKAVNNPSAAWWLRGATAKNGLTWGDKADGAGDWAGDAVLGAPPTGAAAQLTDVVGSRSVTLEASVCLGGGGGESAEALCAANGGAWYAGETTVSFGAGPLSVFTTNPNDGRGKAWATFYGTSAGTGNGVFTSGSNTFPAAGIANGSVRNDTVSTSGSKPPSPMTAAFGGAGWTAGEMTNGHYSTTANLPKVSRLLAVAKYNGRYNTGVPRKGAAFAAGWPDDKNSGWYCYWSGEVVFRGEYGYFYARIVYLVNGYDGWYYVGYGSPVAVGVLP